MGVDDGFELLTTEEVGELLEAAVEHVGGRLVGWSLDHVDANPQYSTTATYSADVEWDYGRRQELLGVSARAGGIAETDSRAQVFGDGDREVAVWLYPDDPDLPGLRRAAYPGEMAKLLFDRGLVPRHVTASDIDLEMITYRPRRRAVVKCDVGRDTYYTKVLRPQSLPDIESRFRMVLEAGLPAPEIVAVTRDALLVTRELPGEAMSTALFGPEDPCTAEQLIDMLDSLPPAIARLERRPPWSDAVEHYSGMVTSAMPELRPRLNWLVDMIESGLANCPLGNEPVHGDFHEGQMHVAGGRVVGLLDIDTVGPGRRADDLACLLAHLSTIQRMTPEQADRVSYLLQKWVPVFDERVDPTELRLRSAAVIISLATGPYRAQEPDWQEDTIDMIDAAEALVRQVL